MRSSRLAIVSLVAVAVTFLFVLQARSNDSVQEGYRLVVEDGVQYYRPFMSLDEYVRQDPGIFNPLKSELSEVSFPVIPLKEVNLDTPGWSLWKSNSVYQVYRSTTYVEPEAIMFYVVDTEREVAIEVLGSGVEIGDAGEIFVASDSYALLKLSPDGRGQMLLPKGSAFGNMSLNKATRQLAFGARVSIYIPAPGVAVLNLEDNSWEMIAHRFNMDGMTYGIDVLWWAEDNTIIIDELDYHHGYFLRKLDLQGNRTEYVSFDDKEIPIWSVRWFSPDKTMIALSSYAPYEVFCFDIIHGTVRRYKDVYFSRWGLSGELLVLSTDGVERAVSGK